MLPPCKDKIYPKDFVFIKPYGFNLLSTFANPPNRRKTLSTFATHPSVVAVSGIGVGVNFYIRDAP
jgi:hypothetical protein